MRVEKKNKMKVYERLIEVEMSNYNDTKRQLQWLKESRRKDVSAATLVYLERTVYALESAIKRTAAEPHGDARLKMLEMLYWNKSYTPEGIMTSINIGRTTYYKWKKDFIRLVADMLGYEI